MDRPELTEEQNKKLRKLAMKTLLRSSFNGINHGAMAMVMCVMLAVVVQQYLGGDSFSIYFGSACIAIFIARRLLAVNKEIQEDAQQELKKITK